MVQSNSNTLSLVRNDKAKIHTLVLPTASVEKLGQLGHTQTSRPQGDRIVQIPERQRWTNFC